MSQFDRLLNWLTGRCASREAIAEELLFQIDERTRENLNSGMDYAAAHKDALLSAGDKPRFRNNARGLTRRPARSGSH
jgi:hypothetical protein